MNQINFLRTNTMVVEGIVIDQSFLQDFKPQLINLILDKLPADTEMDEGHLRTSMMFRRAFTIPLHMFRSSDEINEPVYDFFDETDMGTTATFDNLNVAYTLNHCIRTDLSITVNIDQILFGINNNDIAKIELITKNNNLLDTCRILGIKSYNLSEKPCSSYMTIYEDAPANYICVNTRSTDLKVPMNIGIASCREVEGLIKNDI